MGKMNKLILFTIPLLVSCSIYNNDDKVIIDRQFAAQKWMYLDSYKPFTFKKYNSNEANDAEYHIIYDFRDTEINNCTIIHSQRASNYYKRCGWLIQGYDTELFLTLWYQITGENNTTQNFRYFYEVVELSEERFKLKLIRQSI